MKDDLNYCDITYKMINNKKYKRNLSIKLLTKIIKNGREYSLKMGNAKLN